MDGVGGAGSGRGSGCGRSDTAAKSAEKAACRAEKAQTKKADNEKKSAQPKSSLTDYLKDTFTPQGGWVQAEQRERALEVTRQSPPGSVGAAIHGPLAVATSVVGNICAGNIGDFYESHRSMLDRPATRENIEAFTRLETDHFNAQPDCSRTVGSAMSADTRAAVVDLSAQASRLKDQASERLKEGWDAISGAVNEVLGRDQEK
jgi:hypothetical protein